MDSFVPLGVIFLAVSLLLVTALSGAPTNAPRDRRVVFLGDSITDGHTYPQLVRQALGSAGRPGVVPVNASIGGDTAKGMRARLDRDVFVHRPDIVCVSAVINDILRGVSADDYAKDLRAIVESLRAKNVRVVLMTPSILGRPGRAAQDDALSAYIDAIREIAKDNDGCVVAEVNALMRERCGRAVITTQPANDADLGNELLEPDLIHPNFEGQRVIARAVLDTLGETNAPVPATLRVSLMPGVVTPWRVRAIAKTEPLDGSSVAAIVLDETWKRVALPETTPHNHPWQEHERLRGFAMSLEKTVGAGAAYRAVATVESDRERDAFLNSGAHLQSAWLNGARVYESLEWTGWHAGKERVPIRLRKGANTLLIEAGPQFFLSITDNNDW